MSNGLRDTVALVTGASSGIGEATERARGTGGDGGRCRALQEPAGRAHGRDRWPGHRNRYLVNVSSVAGRRVGAGGGIYQLTKHGVGTFSEALRQEVTARYVRASLIEPGATESELVTHVREEVRSQLPAGLDQVLTAQDIADAILYIVTRPRHASINEILVRPTEQVR